MGRYCFVFDLDASVAVSRTESMAPKAVYYNRIGRIWVWGGGGGGELDYAPRPMIFLGKSHASSTDRVGDAKESGRDLFPDRQSFPGYRFLQEQPIWRLRYPFDAMG